MKRQNPRFGRRHYVAIANIIRTAPVWTGGDAEATTRSVEQMEYLIERFVTLFQHDNARFDRDRFIEACNGDPVYEVTPTGVAILRRRLAASL